MAELFHFIEQKPILLNLELSGGDTSPESSAAR